MRCRSAGVVVAGAVWLVTSVSPPVAGAAAEGLSISPAVVQVELQPQQANKSFELTLTNNTGLTRNLRLSVVNFGALNETGGLYLIGQPNDFERKYGLFGWITLEKDFISLRPGERQTIKATVVNKPSLSPGGHYGAILFKAETSQSGEGTRIDVKPVLTELVFVRKVGGERFSLVLREFDRPGAWARLPKQIKLRFQNEGNVHVAPRGTVTISDRLGRVVSRGTINEDSSLILPESFRVMTTRLKGEKITLVPGKYRMQINFRYDGQEDFAVVTHEFRFANVPMLAGMGAGVLAGVGLLATAIFALRRRLMHY